MDKNRINFMADEKISSAMKTLMIMRINEKRLFRNILVFVV